MWNFLKNLVNFGVGIILLGCAHFAEIWSELTKTWSSGTTECGV